MLEPNDLKKGVIFKYKNNPVEVVDYSHTHKGRGSAIVTAKVKDLLSGNVLTLTFKAGEKLEEAGLRQKNVNYLYCDSEAAYFMNTFSFEQLSINYQIVTEKLNYLKEGQEVRVVEFEDKPIDIILPPKVELKVISTEPGVKGDTASGTAYKPAVLETSYQLYVPLFIKQGDIIKVNTETGEYAERVS